MNAIKLLAEVARLGIRLEARGERLRFHPRSAVTAELAERLKAHKADLLWVLRRIPDVVVEEPTDAAMVDATPANASAGAVQLRQPKCRSTAADPPGEIVVDAVDSLTSPSGTESPESH